MYARNDVKVIADKLLRRNLTVAVAESVTSGHLQAALSLADHAQEFYQGGITVYNVGQKCRHLNIEPIRAMASNGVSKEVAEQMAIAVNNKFSSNWGLSICGYAAPVPELNIQTPYAFFSIAREGVIKASRKVITKATSGRPTQEYFTVQALQAFEAILKKERL